VFKLKIETSLGAVLDFSESNAYTLIDVTGLDPPAAALNFSRFSSGNGSHRVSGYVEKRNIILTAVINNPLEKNRTALNSYFVLDSKVKIYYISDTMNVFTEGYVESCFYNSFELGQKAVISILCENPYWRDTGETGILFSALESRFEFPFSIPDGGVAISEIMSGGAVQIDPGTADNGFKDPIGVQYTCENMLTVVYETCQKYDMGFRLVKRGGVLREKLYFELYKGTDHSESQHVNPIVVFSPDFDNLINSEYCMDMTEYANTAYIAGEGEGNQRKKAILGGSQGKKRREIFVDAGSVSSKSDIVMTDDNYMMALYDKGQEQLSEKRGKFTFSVTIENLNMYKYKQDYDVGDIVTIKNEYGIIADVRITEVTESEDSTGFSVIPTFEQEVNE